MSVSQIVHYKVNMECWSVESLKLIPGNVHILRLTVKKVESLRLTLDYEHQLTLADKKAR